jgi:hypothetical protein
MLNLNSEHTIIICLTDDETTKLSSQNIIINTNKRIITLLKERCFQDLSDIDLANSSHLTLVIMGHAHVTHEETTKWGGYTPEELAKKLNTELQNASINTSCQIKIYAIGCEVTLFEKNSLGEKTTYAHKFTEELLLQSNYEYDFKTLIDYRNEYKGQLIYADPYRIGQYELIGWSTDEDVKKRDDILNNINTLIESAKTSKKAFDKEKNVDPEEIQEIIDYYLNEASKLRKPLRKSGKSLFVFSDLLGVLEEDISFRIKPPKELINYFKLVREYEKNEFLKKTYLKDSIFNKTFILACNNKKNSLLLDINKELENIDVKKAYDNYFDFDKNKAIQTLNEEIRNIKIEQFKTEQILNFQYEFEEMVEEFKSTVKENGIDKLTTLVVQIDKASSNDWIHLLEEALQDNKFIENISTNTKDVLKNLIEKFSTIKEKERLEIKLM